MDTLGVWEGYKSMYIVYVGVQVSAEEICLGMFAWMNNCYTQGRILGRWLPIGGVVGKILFFSLVNWFGAVQGASGLVLTFSLLLSPTNTRVWEGYPGRLSDTQWVVHLDKV